VEGDLLVIERQMSGRVKLAQNQEVDIEIGICLVYDPDTDPLAVRMICQIPDDGDVPWEFARELLLRGAVSRLPYGEGDVRFRYLGAQAGGLLACLRSPEGHADILLPQVEVVAFLNETMNAVRYGEEPLGTNLDDVLKEILGS
jgi:hypothetical protein